MPALVFRDVPFDSTLVQGLLDEWNEELGFGPKGGSNVAASDFNLPRGVFLLALVGDVSVGCGGLRQLNCGTGEVKRLFVRPAARGQGVGRRLLNELEVRARRLGFHKLRLDTHDGATAALALFRSSGYQPVPDYNGNPFASYWFEKSLPRFQR
jgi:ribosomal protein S18 acetylase RimI-like enzyme